MAHSDWIILNKYPFSLLPGTPKEMPDGDLSYYEYLNTRWKETGKNVMAVAWLLRNFPQGLVVEEPFGGCGVFSVALQEMLKPSDHRIGELDDECVTQLHHALASYPTARVSKQDAHEVLGVERADIYVCDFPFFTLVRLLGGYWATELDRMIAHRPSAVLITDGSACRWHWVSKALANRGYAVNSHRTSYAEAFNTYVRPRGYRVTGLAYHGTCFYIRIEPDDGGGAVEFLELPAGSGVNGLKPKGAK